MDFRRKRGPVTLCPLLWPGLPLSDVTELYVQFFKNRNPMDKRMARHFEAIGKYQKERYTTFTLDAPCDTLL